MTWPPLTGSAADPDGMPMKMEQYDTLVTNLKEQLARGGMSYAEAVVVDDIISILVGSRTQTRKNQDRQTEQHLNHRRHD